jgi:hypothetical protein
MIQTAENDIAEQVWSPFLVNRSPNGNVNSTMKRTIGTHDGVEFLKRRRKVFHAQIFSDARIDDHQTSRSRCRRPVTLGKERTSQIGSHRVADGISVFQAANLKGSKQQSPPTDHIVEVVAVKCSVIAGHRCIHVECVDCSDDPRVDRCPAFR